MGALAEIILSFLGLLEAEGRTLRAGIARLALALALAALVAAMLIAGAGLVLASIYFYLRSLNASPAAAAALDGLITLLLAAVIGLVAVKVAK